jgi:hypothetical protein
VEPQLLYFHPRGGSTKMLVSALIIAFIIFGLFLSMLAWQPKS